MGAKEMAIHRLVASENQEQRALVKWIRMQPHLREFIVKLNNEGKRTEAQGWHLKLMGMCPGASDLFLAYPTRQHAGAWIEVKRNKKYTPSEMASPSWVAEMKFQERMRRIGYATCVAYGWEMGKAFIEQYLDDRLIA